MCERRAARGGGGGGGGGGRGGVLQVLADVLGCPVHVVGTPAADLPSIGGAVRALIGSRALPAGGYPASAVAKCLGVGRHQAIAPRVQDDRYTAEILPQFRRSEAKVASLLRVGKKGGGGGGGGGTKI